MAGNMIAKAHAKSNDHECPYGCCHDNILHDAVERGGRRSASKAKREIHQIQRSREKAELRKIIREGE